MPGLNTKSHSHRRLSRFVEWIKTPDEREDKIRAQAEEIRGRITGRAAADGLVVRSIPYSGSFAKRTGLRRHFQGNVEVEGQDVDLPFVLGPRTKTGESLTKLLERFQAYAQASYPSTSLYLTKSSVRLDFVGTKIRYDIVPMLAVEGSDEEQIILRADGEKRRTSLQKHVEFVKRRTRASNEQPGRVKFNEVVRLVKWWRELRQDGSQLLGDVPTIVIELLCAKAFDQLGVEGTYTATLSKWFGLIASLARRREAVGFTDFMTNPLSQSAGLPWAIIDPVNSANNVIPATWGNLHLKEIVDWFENARDHWGRVIAYEIADDNVASQRTLLDIFGNPFKHHGTLDDV
jgi:hypothetical protein